MLFHLSELVFAQVLLRMCSAQSQIGAQNSATDCDWRRMLVAAPMNVARQAPLSMGSLQARILEGVAMLSSKGSSEPKDQTQVSRMEG